MDPAVLVAILAGIPLQLGLVPWMSPFNFAVLDRYLFIGFGANEYLGLYLSAIVLISIILGVFNLLPIFPLDGHRVIPAFLTDQAALSYMKFQSRYGFMILMFLIFTGVLGPLFALVGRLHSAIVY